jgi:SpoVK/Ycf46/Vps4 family AAA+-type ATPase
MQDLTDLALIIESHVPLVILETHDEPHALNVLTRVALRTRRSLCSWSITQGLQNGALAQDAASAPEPEQPLELLLAIKRHKPPSIFVLFDFHPYMHGNPAIVRHIKDIALAYGRLSHTLIFVSHELQLPAEIKRFSARFDLSFPDAQRLATILREELRSWMADHGGERPAVDTDALQQLLSSLKGVTGQDARQLLRAAIRDDGAISRQDVQKVNKARFELLGLDGLMSFESDLRDMDAIAGFTNLKHWLSARQAPFLNSGSGAHTDIPKGILLTGVQGGGKSLAAKAVAGSWNVPLLRLDMAALYNKYIGETEKNLRKCLRLSQQMAPCVLWLDEIEKGIASVGADETTSQRLLGTLLTWLAERKAAVFLVMTANDISRLPAELLRKGRLDEIFFVDLPALHIREEIFQLHLLRRDCNPAHFDLSVLASASEDFSGAEIEQAVVAAIHIAMARGLPVSTQQILEELDRTRPLAVTMAESIGRLRQWAQGRTARA